MAMKPSTAATTFTIPTMSAAKGIRSVSPWRLLAALLLLAARKKVSVNGVFDSRTLSAVKSFQRSGGLQVTGRIDVATWQALLARPAAKIAWGQSSGRSKVTAAGLAQPEPASARLPALMYEIPPKQH